MEPYLLVTAIFYDKAPLGTHNTHTIHADSYVQQFKCTIQMNSTLEFKYPAIQIHNACKFKYPAIQIHST